jgi:O-succinylbenzoic acid--CoA ligase
MSRPLRVVDVTGEPDDVPQVRAALAVAVQPQASHAVAVLPVGPPAWREALAAAVEPHREVPDEVALALPTSGSTGAPAGVLLGASALAWSADAVLTRLGGPGSWLLALPLTHTAGLMVLVRAVRSGSVVHPMDLRRGFGPDAFAAAVDGLPPGRAYVSLVPTQLARLLQAGQARALRRFDAVLLGGAGAAPSLLRDAAAAGVRVVVSYGLTETCGGCVLDGRPLPAVQVELLDGRIHLAGPMLAWGRRHGGRDEPLPGRLATADLGSWDDGRLRVLGRVDDVVESGGVSVALGRVDALLHEHPDVVEAAAVGVDDPDWGTRVVALAVPRDPASPPSVAEVRAFVHARAEPAFVPADVVWVDALPRPAPGKVDRAALRALVAQQGAAP